MFAVLVASVSSETDECSRTNMYVVHKRTFPVRFVAFIDNELLTGRSYSSRTAKFGSWFSSLVQ